MAIFQMCKSGLPTGSPDASGNLVNDLFDDGNPGQPGDPTFSTDPVKAYVAASGGKWDGFSYSGVSASHYADQSSE
jgi:hypothetical protein